MCWLLIVLVLGSALTCWEGRLLLMECYWPLLVIRRTSNGHYLKRLLLLLLLLLFPSPLLERQGTHPTSQVLVPSFGLSG